VRVFAKSAIFCLPLLLAACNQSKPKPSVKQYPLTGKVISIDLKERTAKIDAAAIPDYMGAMTMDYPIASDSDLAALKPGEQISATVNVGSDDSYNLSNIHERAGK
jgi:Cu/Ag efflux protein CusF